MAKGIICWWEICWVRWKTWNYENFVRILFPILFGHTKSHLHHWPLSYIISTQDISHKKCRHPFRLVGISKTNGPRQGRKLRLSRWWSSFREDIFSPTWRLLALDNTFFPITFSILGLPLPLRSKAIANCKLKKEIQTLNVLSTNISCPYPSSHPCVHVLHL